MLSHDFISVSEENITSALNYYPNRKLTGKETRIVKIKDKIILKYIAIFNDVDIFIKLSGQSINRLNYYGCSVIPPSFNKQIKLLWMFSNSAQLLLGFIQ